MKRSEIAEFIESMEEIDDNFGNKFVMVYLKGI